MRILKINIAQFVFATFVSFTSAAILKKISDPRVTWTPTRPSDLELDVQINWKNNWPKSDLNTQPSDLESDALPLHHNVTVTTNKQIEMKDEPTQTECGLE